MLSSVVSSNGLTVEVPSSFWISRKKRYHGAVILPFWSTSGALGGVSGKPSTNIRKVADHEPTMAVRHRDPHLTLAELPQLAPDRAGPIRSHQPQGALHLFRVIAPAVIGILEEIIGSTVVEPTLSRTALQSCAS